MEATTIARPGVLEDAKRCGWANAHPLLAAYHDDEWGIPELDSRALWESLVLDSFQAGLSWLTILKKRDSFRAAFADFDPAIVARFTVKDVGRLMHDDGIVRSRPKVLAAIANARAYERMLADGEDLASLVWSVASAGDVGGDRAALSTGLAGLLVERGYRFVGPLVVHAWLRAAGVFDEHDANCFRKNTRNSSSPFAPEGGIPSAQTDGI